MNKPLIIGSLFMIIFICVIPLKRHLLEYEIQKNGDLVKGIITYVPGCLGIPNKHIRFRYENATYSKRIGGKPCEELKVGDSILLKHLEGTNIFLYEKEDIRTELLSMGIVLLAGIAFIVIGLKKH